MVKLLVSILITWPYFVHRAAEPSKPPASSSKDTEGMKKSAEAEATLLKVEKQQEQQKLEQVIILD